MGINPTPTNHRSFTFDGKSTREFGVYITGKDVFNAPERAVEMISIPGRDGEYALDQGHFNNIEVTYRAGIVADSTTDFAEAISNFRNWLASREGYCRLTDEYNTEEYRMAVFKNAIALEHEGLLTGEFDVTFDCKPQRYLAIGEELTEIGAWGNTETAEGDIVTIDASSDTAVKALTADIEPIQGLHGYDAPWVGGSHYNKWDEDWELGALDALGGNYPSTTEIRSKNYIPIIGGETYYLYSGVASTFNYRFYDENKVYVSGSYISRNNTLTAPNNASYMRFYMWSAYGTTYNNNIAINYPSTVTTYSPYENICPISGHDEVGVSVVGVNLLDNSSIVENEMWTTAGQILSFNGRARSATPIRVLPNTQYYANWTSNTGIYGVQMFDKNMNNVGQAMVGADAPNLFTTPSTAYYACVNIVVAQKETASLNYPSTDHDYHAYNGTTYTTTLPSTTYGGTLDVVSGVLTVTWASVDFGSLGWASNTLKGVIAFYVALSDAKLPSINSVKANIMSSAYEADTANNVYSNTTSGRFSLNTSGYIQVRNSNYSDASTFKTAMTGQTICYELATPQTYQLTPQQVELLLGENHIFADSGNVTVEYGHNPTLLTNPTWFPSKPLVYAKGYGDINLGNRTITVSDEPIGEVLLANKIDRNTSNRSYFDTATLALLNVGDTITVSSGSQLIIGLASSSTSTTITSITATVTGGTAQAIGAPSTYVDRYGDGRIEITMDAFDFANGTTEKATVELDVTVNYKENGTTKSWSSTEFVAGYRYSVVYNAVSFAGFEVEPSLPDDIYSYIPRDATIENIYGYSTKQITADGYYIDLDIGEAYTMVDGVPSSINNLVTMPSDLPTLPPGDTEVTYDNTITKVEVKPNYWKV